MSSQVNECMLVSITATNSSTCVLPFTPNDLNFQNGQFCWGYVITNIYLTFFLIQGRVVVDGVVLKAKLDPTNVTLPMCMPGQRISIVRYVCSTVFNNMLATQLVQY